MGTFGRVLHRLYHPCLLHCKFDAAYVHQGKLGENIGASPGMHEPARTPTEQLPKDLHQRLLGGRYPLWDLPSLVLAERSSDFSSSRPRQSAVLEHTVLSEYGPV